MALLSSAVIFPLRVMTLALNRSCERLSNRKPSAFTRVFSSGETAACASFTFTSLKNEAPSSTTVFR